MKRRAPRIVLPVEIPRPKSRRPWGRKPNVPPIYDADDKVVSFIENAAFLFHVEQCHDDLVAALRTAKNVLLLHVRGIRGSEELKRINAALKKATGKVR
jgi:hypothetical protein